MKMHYESRALISSSRTSQGAPESKRLAGVAGTDAMPKVNLKPRAGRDRRHAVTVFII